MTRSPVREVVPAPRARPEDGLLPLVADLCGALDQECVSYCHWKSNAALAQAVRGETDLDFLVARGDAQRFSVISRRLGFKETRPARRSAEVPGVVHYWGYDSQSDRFVHVHAHFQLVLGDDTTKNYHLPIERAFLASARRSGLVPIPAPELELAVFVIRMILKHWTWDALLMGRGRLPPSASFELDYLRSAVGRTGLGDIVGASLECLDRELIDICLESLQGRPSIWARARLAQRVHRALRAHARRRYIPDVCLKALRRVVGFMRRRIGGRPRRGRLANGGAIIALVGGDGAGKSSAIHELHAWLSRVVDTKRFHLGKPPRSWTMAAFLAALKLTRWVHGAIRFTAVPPSTGLPTITASPVVLLRAVFLARARYRAYGQARRFASNGGIVLCDRYPLPTIQSMDGPWAARFRAMPQKRWLRHLSRLELRYYRHILAPDLLVVLRVDPETAQRRKDGEPPEMVRTRCREIWEKDWTGSGAHVVDAGRPQPEVIAYLKQWIWREL